MTVQAVTVTNGVSNLPNVQVATWAALANGDSGAPIEYSHYSDKTIQLDGTLGVGGTVLIEGSNDGTNYYTLHDKQGVALSLTALGIKSLQDNPKFIRPRASAGDGTTLLVVTISMTKYVR